VGGAYIGFYVCATREFVALYMEISQMAARTKARQKKA
jgi:hypothetical protein